MDLFKLVRNFFLLVVMVVIVLMAMVFLIPADTNSYLAAAKDKHRMLYEVKSPRIILVGGSNVAFGVDSQKIEDSFHMPVINAGLNANLGLRFMLDEVKAALRGGDVVILFPEYELFFNRIEGLPKVMGAVIKICPECILSADSPRQILCFGIGLFPNIEDELTWYIKGQRLHQGIYSRQSFDRHGDMVKHLESNRVLSDTYDPLDLPADINDSLSHNHAIELLNSFSQSCKAANARVFLMFPSIVARDYFRQEKQFNDLSDKLADSLEIPIVGVPQDFAYSRKLFFNTNYHLNSIGREIRTDHIIQLLSSALEK